MFAPSARKHIHHTHEQIRKKRKTGITKCHCRSNVFSRIVFVFYSEQIKICTKEIKFIERASSTGEKEKKKKKKKNKLVVCELITVLPTIRSTASEHTYARFRCSLPVSFFVFCYSYLQIRCECLILKRKCIRRTLSVCCIFETVPTHEPIPSIRCRVCDSNEIQ